MSQLVKVALRATLALLIVGAASAPVVGAQSTDARFFSQTNFRVDNDAFWDFFQHRGAVRTFGYPVSRQFKLDGFNVQIFQREVMQQWPDGSVHTLNLLDTGLLPYTQINGSTFPAPDQGITVRRQRQTIRPTRPKSCNSSRSVRPTRSTAKPLTSAKPSAQQSALRMRRRCT